MSASRNIPIAQVVDDALERLLRGESPETILAHYSDHAQELSSILFTAQAVERAPRPEIPQAFLSSLVSQAQVQAQKEAARRKVIPLPVPAPPATNGVVDGYEAHSSGSPGAGSGKYNAGNMREPARRPEAVSKPGFAQRVAQWLRPAGPFARVPLAVTLLIFALAGILAIVRMTEKPDPPYPPVPTVLAQFTLDGKIEQLGSFSWVVGGDTIYMDKGTVIIGRATIGGQAHIRGEIKDGNRRVASEISISSTFAPTALPILASATTAPTADTTPQWRMPEATTGVPTPPNITILPGPPSPTVVAYRTPLATHVASLDGTLPTIRVVPTFAPARTSTTVALAPTQPAVRTTGSAIIRATNTVLIAPTRLPVSATSTTPPISTATLRPVSTNTVISITATKPEVTATRLPETAVVATSTHVATPPSTAAPTGTPAQPPTLTLVPTNTATSRPTGAPDPSATTEPEDTAVPVPTLTVRPPLPSPTSANPTGTTAPTPLPTSPADPTTRPTSQPSSTVRPTVEPTRTALPASTATHSPVPEETRTAEPTHVSGETHTPQTTRTREPDETHTPNPTEQPHGTETVEPTHRALPLP